MMMISVSRVAGAWSEYAHTVQLYYIIMYMSLCFRKGFGSHQGGGRIADERICGWACGWCADFPAGGKQASF